eukprot:1196271-Prorocentrum_minimum.AAC.8
MRRGVGVEPGSRRTTGLTGNGAVKPMRMMANHCGGFSPTWTTTLCKLCCDRWLLVPYHQWRSTTLNTETQSRTHTPLCTGAGLQPERLVEVDPALNLPMFGGDVGDTPQHPVVGQEAA